MMEIFLDELNQSIEGEFNFYFKYIETIASGSFGTVMRAIYLENNREVAVKIIDKKEYNHKNISRLRHEINILQQLKHKNIVEYIGFIETNHKMYIITEFIKDGTLKDLINNMQKQNKKFTEEESSEIMKSLFDAVEYLHSREIIHRDLKPENILFEDTKNLSSLKVIDFGLSAQFFESNSDNEYCGTIIYMAPEQLEKKVYTKSIDIWSCGIIMYKLLNNDLHPFYKQGDSTEALMEKIKIGKWETFDKISEMGNHLQSKLLEINTCKRYSADQVLKHPWIKRSHFEPIPLTYLETMRSRTLKNKLVNFFGAVIYLSEFSKKLMLENPRISEENLTKASRNKKDLKQKNYKMNEKFDLEKYETKVNSISKLMHEAYKKRRESCLSITEKFKESPISPENSDKNLISKYNFNFSKLTTLNDKNLNHISSNSTPKRIFGKPIKALQNNKKYILRIPKERKISSLATNFKTEKSNISNISSQKTEDCSPIAHNCNKKPSETEKIKINKKEKNNSNTHSLSPDISSNIRLTDNYQNNSEFKLKLKPMNSLGTLSTVKTKKILNSNENSNSIFVPTSFNYDPQEDLYILKSTFAEKNHAKNVNINIAAKSFVDLKLENPLKNSIFDFKKKVSIINTKDNNTYKRNKIKEAVKDDFISKPIILPNIITPIFKNLNSDKNLNVIPDYVNINTNIILPDKDNLVRNNNNFKDYFDNDKVMNKSIHKKNKINNISLNGISLNQQTLRISNYSNNIYLNSNNNKFVKCPLNLKLHSNQVNDI